MARLQSAEQLVVGLLLVVALLTFFFPLMTLQIPLLGNQSVSGYDIFTKTRQFRQQLTSIPKGLGKSDSKSTQRSTPSTDSNEIALPISVQSAAFVPLEVTVAFACALLTLPGCFPRLHPAHVRVMSSVGSIAAVTAILHLTIINSDLHEWFQQSMQTGSGSPSENPFAGLMQQLGNLVVNTFQVKAGAGLYVLAVTLVLVAFLSYSRLLVQMAEPIHDGPASPRLPSATVVSPASAKRTSRTTIALVAVILLLLGAIVFLVFEQRGTKPGASVAENRESLFRQSRSCALTRQWTVDFAGNGSPYHLEEHRCTAAELSKFELAKSLDLSANSVYGGGANGYYVLLVIKPYSFFPDKLLHGEFADGEYSFVEPTNLKLQRREGVAVDGPAWGSGGESEWCLLAQEENGEISCWREQQGDLQKYLGKFLRPDENTKAWHLIEKNGILLMVSDVEAQGDANCCPTRGEIQVELNPRDGVLYWADVTRLASARSAASPDTP